MSSIVIIYKLWRRRWFSSQGKKDTLKYPTKYHYPHIEASRADKIGLRGGDNDLQGGKKS